MPKRRFHSRPGFTLAELLIGCALSGVVLAMALNGFVNVNKVASLSRSKIQVKQLAADGLQQMSSLLGQAHVFYYTGRPLRNIGGAYNLKTGRRGQEPETDAVPLYLKNSRLVGTTLANLSEPGAQNALGAVGTQISDFRFDEFMGTNVLEVAPAARDRQRNMADPEYVYNNTFPSPLAYVGLADFSNNVTAGGNQLGALPESWTFYVFYLAPMSLTAGDPNLTRPLNTIDDLPPPPVVVPGVTNRRRTMMPLQLRLMTIKKVLAASNPTKAGNYIRGRQAFSTDSSAALANRQVLEPPYDYEPGTPANYDPLPIKTQAGNAERYDNTIASSRYYYLPPGVNNQSWISACGPRIAGATGAGVHPNYNNVGNDPPTNTALQRLVAGLSADQTTVTDKVVVPYIDPDSASGTSVRFVNNLYLPSEVPLVNPPVHAYRKYIPTIGSQCDYAYNYRQDVIGEVASGVPAPFGATRPERVLISVTTRYRSTSAVPFQFTTVSAEVNLEGLKSFDMVRLRER